MLDPSLTGHRFRFNHTIRFCSWSGEEQGLYGSRAYAQKAKDAGENIAAALNADMIGTDDASCGAWRLPGQRS